MSYCTFIASDSPLREVIQQKAYPLTINFDEGTVYDGGEDDSFGLYAFKDVQRYTDKNMGYFWNGTIIQTGGRRKYWNILKRPWIMTPQ